MKIFRTLKSITCSLSLFMLGGAYVDTGDAYYIAIALMVAIWATIEVE